MEVMTVPQVESISIHAPREGSDRLPYFPSLRNVGFQSTLPVRGATTDALDFGTVEMNFNPRSP